MISRKIAAIAAALSGRTLYVLNRNIGSQEMSVPTTNNCKPLPT